MTTQAEVDRFFAASDYQEPRPLEMSVIPDRPDPTLASDTPEWWLDRLYRALRKRNLDLSRLRAYYEGTNPTWKLADAAHRRTFGTAFQDLRMNISKAVVELHEQRMTVIGMQLWDDDEGSDRAWEIWQANQLDAASSQAHLHVLSQGECPVLVSGNPDDPRNPLITVEDPMQVIVECDPANPRKRLAALKVWRAVDDVEMAVLYLPAQVTWYRGVARKGANGSGAWTRQTWLPVPDKSQQNPLGVVPVVVLRNASPGRAEHEAVIHQSDLIANALYQMTTAGAYAAYPQRHASGVDLSTEAPQTDAQGNEVAPPPAQLDTGPDTVVSSENPDARFGNFAVSDLQPFISAIREYRSQAAVVISVPQRLLVAPPTSVPSSGESVRLDDAPFTARIRRKHTAVGNGWEEAIRLAFLVAGDTARAARMDMEAVWADPELHSEAEHIDALVKMQAMGVPQDELWRRIGATPQQIRRWRNAAEGALGTASGPTTPARDNTPPGGPITNA